MTTVPVYFSASDRQIERILSLQDFERSLLMNILFQAPLLETDIFFFISNHLVRHMENADSRWGARKSIFEQALRHGLIIPSFRNPNTKSFPDALTEVGWNDDIEHEPDKIFGVLPSAKKTAERLQRTLDNSKTEPQSWPDEFEGTKMTVGQLYQRTVEDYLQTNTPPDPDPRLEGDSTLLLNLWDSTRWMREDIVQRAIDSDVELATTLGKPADWGLRRGTVYRALAREIGAPEDDCGNNSSLLLNYARTDVEKLALDHFLNWVNIAYHHAQARALGVRPNFPAYNPITNSLALRILSGYEEKPAAPGSPSVLQLTAALPHPSALLEIDPAKLMDIRAESGYKYLEALESWQATPSLATEEALQSEFGVYSQEICQEAGVAYNSLGSLDIVISKRLGIPKPLANSALIMAGVAAGALNPPIGLVLGVSSALYVLYRYREVGPRDVPVEVVTYALPEAATVSEVSEHPGRLESPDVNCPAGSID